MLCSIAVFGANIRGSDQIWISVFLLNCFHHNLAFILTLSLTFTPSHTHTRLLLSPAFN